VPVLGVEQDPVAASSFCANVPGAGSDDAPLEQFLAALRAGQEGWLGRADSLQARDGRRMASLPTNPRCLHPRLAEPGSVAYLHASPPCRSLSQRNRKRCYERYRQEMVVLLDQVGRCRHRQPAGSSFVLLGCAGWPAAVIPLKPCFRL
jgi:site-specific DNA-cytosine methylase